MGLLCDLRRGAKADEDSTLERTFHESSESVEAFENAFDCPSKPKLTSADIWSYHITHIDFPHPNILLDEREVTRHQFS